MLVEGVPGKAEAWAEGRAMVPDEFPLLDHFTARKEGPVVNFRRRMEMDECLDLVDDEA